MFWLRVFARSLDWNGGFEWFALWHQNERLFTKIKLKITFSFHSPIPPWTALALNRNTRERLKEFY